MALTPEQETQMVNMLEQWQMIQPALAAAAGELQTLPGLAPLFAELGSTPEAVAVTAAALKSVIGDHQDRQVQDAKNAHTQLVGQAAAYEQVKQFDPAPLTVVVAPAAG